MKFQLLSIVCLAGLAGIAAGNEPVLDRPVPPRVTGREFNKALEIQTSASWRNVELAAILDRLANEYQTAIVLDRSLNPNQELDLDLGYQRLLTGLEKIAQAVSADLCILGNTIYIGPPKRVAKLRTLAHLRASEPLAREDQLPKGRAVALSRSETVHWNDLDEPRQLVVDLASRAGIEVINPEAIPHDLWATGTLPEAALTEALSLILIQFDLTFAWNADTTQIRLQPVPEVVAIEKPYTPQGAPSLRAARSVRERFLENAAKEWEQQYPGLTGRVDLDNNRVLLSGTLEQHEALSGTRRLTANAKPAANKAPPIKNRQFTLRIERIPASALMKKLEESGVQFDYDKAQLAAKNIDLDTPISMDVNKASAEEFFRAICDPLGLKFSIDQLTVTLTPK